MSKKPNILSVPLSFGLMSIVLFIAFINPFIYIQKAVDPALIPRIFFFSILTFVLHVFIFYRIVLKKQLPAFTKTEFIALSFSFGYVLVSAISAFFATNFFEAIFETLKSFLFASFFLFLLVWLKPIDQNLKWIIKAVVFSVLILLVLAFFQFLRIDLSQIFSKENYLDYYYTKEINFVSATQANKNLFSSLLFLSLVFSFIGYIYFQKFWKMFCLAVGMGSLLFIGLLITRAVWLSIVLAHSAAFAFWLLRSLIKKDIKVAQLFTIKKLVLYAVILGLFFGGVVFLIKFKEGKVAEVLKSKVSGLIRNDYFDREKLMSTGQPNSAETRLITWYKTIDMFNQHPLTGIGPGNWQVMLPAQNLDAFESDMRQAKKYITRPHNDFLWVLSETGIFGFLFYFGLFVFVMVLSLLLFINAADWKQKVLGLIVVSGLFGFMLVSFVDFPKERVEHNLLIYIAFALVILMYDSNTDNKISKPNLKLYIPISLLFLIVSFIALLAGYQRFTGELQSNKIIQSQLDGKWQMELRYLNRVQGSFYSIDAFTAPVNWYKGTALVQTGRVKEGIEAFEKAYLAHPYHLGLLNNLASAHFLNSNYEKAEKYYKEALEISSTYKEVIVNLSMLYARVGKIERAYTTLLDCDRKGPMPEKYDKVLIYLLEKKVEKLENKVGNKELKEKLKELKSQKKTLKEIHNKSIKNGTSFKEEALRTLKR